MSKVDYIEIDEQNRKFAVDARDCNILLSAAAGSGKTTTLVKRIVTKLLYDEKPTSIDRLLVVTFTNAAAAELRQRIDSELTDEFNKAIEEGNDMLAERAYRQKLLVPKAMIGTIDAFCLDVVKKNFVTAGIDPVFRIEDKEVEIMRDSVISDVLEEYYGRTESDEYIVLRELVDVFCDINGDDDFKTKILIPMYKFAVNFESPKDWLKGVKENYSSNEVWHDYIKNSLITVCEEIIDHIDLLADCIVGNSSPSGNHGANFYMNLPNPEQYLKSVMGDKAVYQNVLDRLKENDEAIFCNIFKVSLPPVVRKTAAEKAGIDAFSAHNMYVRERNKYKAYFEESCSALLPWFREKDSSFDVEYYEAMFRNGVGAVGRYINLLCDIVGYIIEGVSEKMRHRRIYNFPEIAHMAYDILKDDGVAEGYRAVFDEIYIDEYQDTSALQERLLRRVSRVDTGSDNMFMVGDVKQSIYRFRYAKPDYFIEKYNLYREQPEKGELRILSRNFRSREKVLEAVNGVFAAVMRKGVCEIEYTPDVFLNYGAKNIYDANPLNDKNGGRAELYVCGNATKENPIEKDSLRGRYGDEALLIADKIISLFEQGFTVYDKAEGMRPIRFSDIAIVTRKNAQITKITAAMTELGLPVAAVSEDKLFDRQEINTVINFLRVIDNPYRDLPLAAVLRSAYYGFNDNMLAEIKADTMYAGSFYESVCNFAELYQNADDVLNVKIRGFLADLRRFRELARVETVSRLLWLIINHNEFYEKNGSCGKGNLRMLLELSYPYDSGDRAGLYNFITYMDSVIEKGYKNFSAYAENSAENDKIQILTIHKSKGLEYPVLFIYGIADKPKPEEDKIYLDEDLGVGIGFLDVSAKNGGKNIRSSAAFCALCDIDEKKALAEEQRMLYVAMTRAREKLFITAKLNKSEYDNLQYMGNGVMPLQTNLGARMAKSYYGMIEQAVFAPGEENTWIVSRIPDLTALLDKGQAIKRLNSLKKAALSSNEAVNIPFAEEAVICRQKNLSELEEREVEKLNCRLEKLDEGRLPAKLSVSSVKRMLRLEDEELSAPRHAKPSMKKLADGTDGLRKASFAPAAFGTLMHKCMQFLLKERKLWQASEQNNIASYVDTFLEKIHGEGVINSEEFALADRNMLCKFLVSKRALLIKEAQFACSETAFTYLVDLSHVLPEMNGKIALQGVIDLYYKADDGIVLVDFKTDRITPDNAEKLCNDYLVQLRCYVEALQGITGMRVSSAVLVFLRTGQEYVYLPEEGVGELV